MLSKSESIIYESRKWVFVVLVSGILIIILTGVARLETSTDDILENSIDGGATAWMLAATSLIMTMSIPGLALYYHGFANKSSHINTLAMVFISYVIVSILWVLYGYALAFGDDAASGFIGNGRKIFLQGLSPNSISTLAPFIPEYIYCAFQCGFAALTTALFCGGLIERVRFSS